MIIRIRSKKFIFVLLVMIAISFWIIHKYKFSKQITQDATMVEVAVVSQGNIPIEIKTVGSLVAAKSVQLTTEVAGQIAKILVKDGSFVKAAAPLIQLDDAVNQSKAYSANAALKFSEGSYQRMQLLGKKGAISKQAIDQALAEYKEKKAFADENRILTEKMLILAPFEGKIGKMKVNVGEYVTVGEPLVSLTDTKHLRVEFSVPEKYFSKLALGQMVRLITSAYPNKTFFGKVAYIAPTINTDDRSINVYADVPNEKDMLTAGLFVTVTLFLGNKDNALLIPAESIVATIDGEQIFKVVNGKALAMSVTLGERTEKQVQIMKGIKKGDTVIIAGQQKIKDGMLVKPIER